MMMSITNKKPSCSRKAACTAFYSRSACWRWLFQTRNIWRFTRSQYVFDLFSRWHHLSGSRCGSLGYRV